jgi:hypothetical protein
MRTHHSVQFEFHRGARGAPGIDSDLPALLSRVSRMKTAAYYERGSDMPRSPEEVKASLNAASTFVAAFAKAISSPLAT